MEDNNQNSQGFHIHVNSPGNFIAQRMTFTAPINIGDAQGSGTGFSDEQIREALMACVGREKVINAKWKWAGAYWYLRWACKYPVDTKDFCTKIRSLGLDIEECFECDYRNIREYTTLSFMDQDATKMQSVTPSRSDEKVFAICREIALTIAEKIGKVYLPRV